MNTADKDVVFITEYSPAEGEPFEPWPVLSDIALLPPDTWLLESKRIVESAIYEKKIKIGNVILHAFRTSDGREWDAINGWHS